MAQGSVSRRALRASSTTAGRRCHTSATGWSVDRPTPPVISPTDEPSTGVALCLPLVFTSCSRYMAAWSDIGATMRDPTVRLIAIEHQFGMVVAVALVHIGRGRIRKIQDAARRHRTALVFFGLALVVMVISIPWPGRPGGRELFRGLGL